MLIDVIFLIISFIATSQADLFFETGMFDKAALEYRKEASRLKEVESLYFARDYKTLIRKFEKEAPVGEEKYFLALSYQMIGEEEKMLKFTEEYLRDPLIDPNKAEQVKNHLLLWQAKKWMSEGKYLEAEKVLSNLKPSPEILYCLIQAKEGSGTPKKDLESLFKTILAMEPSTPFHAAAYFEFYSFQDYLMGKKEALCHLREYVKRFEKSPYTIAAWYLIGLDLKRERKSESGRRIHGKNLEQAVDAFYKAETLYVNLEKNFNENDKAYWLLLKTKATLERARTLIEIANESSTTKKHIYLTYAQEVLEPLAEPEARLLLAEVYLADLKIDSSLTELNRLEKTTDTYFLAKTLLAKGQLLYQKGEMQSAIHYLEKAQKAAPKESLSADEILEAKITIGLCYKAMGELDKAMLVMSDVVNSEFVSSLRVKAMYLRALIYESQGRPELAKRQLEAALSKGGEWAALAKEKWSQEYHE